MQHLTDADETPPRRRPWKRVFWLLGMMVAFYVAVIGFQLVAELWKLPLVGRAGLGQVGILLVALLFAALDGDGFRPLGILGRWKGYDAGVIIGIISLHLLGSLLMAPLIIKITPGVLESSAATGLLNTFASFDTGTFTLIAMGLALQAGVGEELLFRGYLISRLERLGLPAWGCIVGSGLIFGLMHWSGYGLLSALSKGIFFGIPTGIYFWYRRNLGPLMTAHTLMNFLGFMAAHAIGKYFPNLPLH